MSWPSTRAAFPEPIKLSDAGARTVVKANCRRCHSRNSWPGSMKTGGAGSAAGACPIAAPAPLRPIRDPINRRMEEGMKRIRPFLIILVAVAVGAAWVIACSPPKSEPVKTVTIPDGEYDPTVWGKAYPLEYDSWLKSKEPNPPLTE